MFKHFKKLAVICSLFPSVFLFVSCSEHGVTSDASVNVEDTSSPAAEISSKASEEASSTIEEEKTISLPITYIFDENKDVAQVAWNYGFPSTGLESIVIKEDIIAGDCINIVYTGTWNTTMTYPYTHTLEGKVISYDFSYTDLDKVTVYDVNIDKEILKTEGRLPEESQYVIQDEELHFIKLSEANTGTVYISKNLQEYDRPKPTIVGIYAFEIRK